MTDEVKTEEKKDGWYPGKGVEAVGGAIADNPGGAVGGALVGTLIFPGVGTVVGMGVGAWWSKKRKERKKPGTSNEPRCPRAAARSDEARCEEAADTFQIG